MTRYTDDPMTGLPNQDQAQDQDDESYQLTGDDLSELHTVAQHLQAGDDPRAQKLWDVIAAQSGGGDGSGGPKFRVATSPPVTSWVDDLENTLWGGRSASEAVPATTEDTTSDDESASAEASSETTDIEQESSGVQGPSEAGNGIDDDYASAEPGDLSGGPVRQLKHSDNYETEYDGVTPEDLASGNYIRVGFRHLLRDDPSKLAYHTYFEIPIIKDGQVTTDEKGRPYASYGVLGDDKGKNQQVRKNDPKNDQLVGHEGKVVYVKVTPEQREALRDRLEYFSDNDNGNYKHSCPVCGPNYHLLGQNSNTFAYNMMFWNPAGMIWAPKPPDNKLLIHPTPKYKENLGKTGWYE